MNIASSIILSLHVLVFIANIILGYTVVRANHRSLENILFGVYALSLALWNISLFLTITSLGGSIIQLWCSRLAFSFYLLMINSFFFFAVRYPENAGGIKSPRRRHWLDVIFWLATAGLFALTLTPYLVKGNIKIIDGFITGELGPLMSIFSWYYVALIGFSIIILVYKLFKYQGLIRVKLWYTLVGFFVFAVPMIITNIIMPVFFGIFKYNNLGPIFSFPMLVVIARVIMRHRFMDIRQALARLVTYFFLIIFLGVIYVTGVSLATSLIIKDPNATSNLGIAALFAVAIAFSLQPLKSIFSKLTNKIFYRRHYDENRLLYSLAVIMSSSLRLNDLNRNLLRKILAEMHISRGAIILMDDKKIFRLSYEQYDRKPEFTEVDLKELVVQSEIIVSDELADNRLKQTMRRLGVEVIVPLRTRKKRDNILILGEKLSGEPYTEQDIGLLEIFASTAAVAIDNTSSVEQLIQLDELKSEFITVVSHQLRTPLSVARWNFELLLDGSFGRLAPKVKNIAQDTYKALMELNKGLNNLMLVLEIEEKKVAMKYDTVNFNQDVLREALVSAQPDFQAKGIKLQQNLLFDRPIKLDRHKILETVKSLLANAVEYSPAGVKMEVSTELIKKDGRSELLFTIKDQGIGVSAKNTKFIFQKFFRGEEAKKMAPNGFGLSLFIARAFVELHGGQIWLEEKREPFSAIFCFSLPLK